MAIEQNASAKTRGIEMKFEVYAEPAESLSGFIEKMPLNILHIISAVFTLLLGACASPPDDARPIPNVAEFLSKVKVWDVEAKFGPVYFGSIHAYERDTEKYDEKSIENCLALAFVKVEGDQVHYIHKLWEPDGKGCQFANHAGTPNGLQKPECFVEPESTQGTRALTPEALSKVNQPGTFSRQLDLSQALAGFIEACTHAEIGGLKDFLRGQGITSANVFELKFQDGKMLMHTNPILWIEWLYKIDLKYVDVFQASPVYPTGIGS